MRRALAGQPPPETAESSPQSPERVLGALLAPLGSVELAHRLAELPASESPRGGEDFDVQSGALRERARRRLDELRRAADQPLRAPFEGRGPLAGPAAVHARIEELCAALGSDATDEPLSAGELAAAARELAGPFHDRVGLAVRRARGVVAGVRMRLRDEIRALGEQATRLEELDALVLAHTAAKTTALFDRIPTILTEQFEGQLHAAVTEAPRPPPRAYTEAFFADGGWIAAHVDRCRETVVAVFEHERRALWGFINAVCEVDNV